MDTQSWDGGGAWEAVVRLFQGGEEAGDAGEVDSKDEKRHERDEKELTTREEVEALLQEEALAEEGQHGAERDLLLWVACFRSREVCGEENVDFVVEELNQLNALLGRACKMSEDVSGTVEPGYVIQAVVMALGGFEVLARMLLVEDQALLGGKGQDLVGVPPEGLSTESVNARFAENKTPMWTAASPVVWHLLEQYEERSTGAPEVQIEESYKSKLTNKYLNRMTVEDIKRLMEWRDLRTRRAKTMALNFEVDGRMLPPKVQRMLYDRPKKEQERIMRDIEFAKFGVLSSSHEIKRQQRESGKLLGSDDEDEDEDEDETGRGSGRKRADWREKFSESAAKAAEAREAAARAIEEKAAAEGLLRFQVATGVTQTTRLQQTSDTSGVSGTRYRLAIVRDAPRTQFDGGGQKAVVRGSEHRISSTESRNNQLSVQSAASVRRLPPTLQRGLSSVSMRSWGQPEARPSLVEYLRQRPTDTFDR